MMLALQTTLAIAPAADAGFIPLADAAALLSRDTAHLRRVCSDSYEAIGLARKNAQGEWLISRAADPRLAGFETREARDLRQLAEQRKAGVAARSLNRAMAQRDIIHGWLALDDVSGSEDARRQRFINRLAADGTLARAGIKKLKPRTLRAWTELYGREGIACLVKRTGWRKGENRIGTHAWAMFLEIMRIPGQTVTVTRAYAQVRGHIIRERLGNDDAWTWPALRTVQRQYQVGVPGPAKVLMRNGPKLFEARCIPKITRDPSDVAAGEWLVGDEHTFDFQGRADGERGPYRIRFKLTAWRCVRSRKMVGWFIGPRANSDTILSSFKMAVTMTGTIPRIVTIDNGTDYRAVGGPPKRRAGWDEYDGDRVQGAIERLSIDVNYAIPFHPWAKAVESEFRTLTADFAAFMPSFWGGRPDRRPEDAERWTKKHVRDLPTLDPVREAFTGYLEGRHSQPSRGLGMEGLSPNAAFAEFYTTSPRYAEPGVLELLLCRHVGPVKVGRDGVRHEGVNYGTIDQAVFLLQGREVWIALDPVQRDRITLCEKDGTPLCVARAARPIGATSDEFRERIAHQKRCKKIVREYAPSRDYLMKTPVQQINANRLAAAKSMASEPLPARPAAERVELVRADLVPAVQKVARAAGAEALRKLGALNDAARAMNEAPLNILDFAREIETDTPSDRRRLDIRDLAGTTELDL